MKKIVAAAMLFLGCATTQNPYAYNGLMTKKECEAECGSRAYPVLSWTPEYCECNTFQCLRSGAGGCEKLPPRPGSNPSNRM